MAITATTTSTAIRAGNTVRTSAIGNRIPFTFTATAGEKAVEVELREADNTTPIVRLSPRVFFSGTVTVDVDQLLRDEIEFSTLGLYGTDVDFGNDTESGIRYTVYWREAGSLGAFSTDGNIYLAIGGAFTVKQGKEYGANYAEFAIVNGGLGKWLTRLTKKRMFYIRSGSSASVFSDALRVLRDPSNTEDSYNLIVRKLQVDGTTITINERAGGAITDGIVYVDSDDWASDIIGGTIEFKFTVGVESREGIIQALTETITYKVQQVCQNVHAIRWINSLGFWEVWAFEGDSEESQNISSIGVYDTNPATLKGATGNRFMLGFEGFNTIQLRDETLTTDEAIWMQELFISPKVQYYVGDMAAGQPLNQWEDVTIEGGGVTINPRKTLQAATVQIGLSKLYTLKA